MVEVSKRIQWTSSSRQLASHDSCCTITQLLYLDAYKYEVQIDCCFANGILCVGHLSFHLVLGFCVSVSRIYPRLNHLHEKQLRMILEGQFTRNQLLNSVTHNKFDLDVVL